MPTVTNRKYSQALKGQNVIVTLNGSDATNYLADLTLGQKCTLGSSGKVGYISEIDLYGTTFKIVPANMGETMASTTPKGYLAVNETINIV